MIVNMSRAVSVSFTMIIRAFLLAAALCLTAVAFSQFSKTVHNSFEADEASTITLDLAGEVAAEPWAGNTVLVETQIRLYNASKGIFEHFVERDGRYEVLFDASGDQLRIYSKDMVRKPIQSKNGLCAEEVYVRVYIPKDFTGSELGPFTRSQPDSGR